MLRKRAGASSDARGAGGRPSSTEDEGSPSVSFAASADIAKKQKQREQDDRHLLSKSSDSTSFSFHLFADSPSFFVKPRTCARCAKRIWAGVRGFVCQRDGCSVALHVGCLAQIGDKSDLPSTITATDAAVDDEHVTTGATAKSERSTGATDGKRERSENPKPFLMVAGPNLGPCPRPHGYDDSASAEAAERAFDAELLDTTIDVDGDNSHDSLDGRLDDERLSERGNLHSGNFHTTHSAGLPFKSSNKNAVLHLPALRGTLDNRSRSKPLLAANHSRQAAGFGVFAPRNRAESKAMERALRTKLLQELRTHSKSGMTMPHLFSFADAFPFITDAAQAIRQDGFTPCFESRKSKPWNFNLYLYPIWMIGLLFRYAVLFPLRLAFLIVGTVLGTLLLMLAGALLREPWRGKAQRFLLQSLATVWLASWTSVVRYHGPRPAKRPNQVFVANHTTIFDIVILFSVRVFSIVGQKHPGLMGFFQDNVLNSIDCLWFDRKDSSDRQVVFNSIREHARHPTKNPLLLFPEGTCVNNEYCVMFKKGAFEIGATVYPIAIKYNKTFADPFYNSRQQSFLRHTFNLLTAWSVVCDVWFLEPQSRHPGESVIDFTNRVKRLIAKKAGLKNVPWDGYLKYFKPSEKFVEEKRRLFASTLLARYSQANLVDLERSFLDSEDDTASSISDVPDGNATTALSGPRSELRSTTGGMRFVG